MAKTIIPQIPRNNKIKYLSTILILSVAVYVAATIFKLFGMSWFNINEADILTLDMFFVNRKWLMWIMRAFILYIPVYAMVASASHNYKMSALVCLVYPFTQLLSLLPIDMWILSVIDVAFPVLASVILKRNWKTIVYTTIYIVINAILQLLSMFVRIGFIGILTDSFSYSVILNIDYIALVIVGFVLVRIIMLKRGGDKT